MTAGTLQTAFAQKKKNKKKQKTEHADVSAVQFPANYTDSISYAFGVVLGHNLKAESVYDLDLEVVKRGIQAVLGSEELLFEGQESRELVNAHIQNKRKEAIQRNLEESEAFLAENGTKDNIQTTESGLQYEILVEGDGPVPTINDKVKTHYHGTLVDGTVFDSSVKRGEPLEFPLKGVIKGWTEVLQLMPVGSKWKIYLHPKLAYGEQGAGQKIGPNMALIFEIELLDIVE